ncbi:MAG: LuxR C-terminal-related transcriptional regulator [Polyangiaceae bacterium]|nr:LuxR C-terminal-related transcriptional regulator [Polyangiaceae bacterium]
MSAQEAKVLNLIPVTQPSQTGPVSETRLSPRGLAEATEHQPVVRGLRLSRESFLKGDWFIVDATRRGPELRVLLRPGQVSITAREREILEAVLKGEPDRDLSLRLGITRQCVCGHLGNALTKIGAETRFAALQTWRTIIELEKGRRGRAMMAEVRFGEETLLSLRSPIAPRAELEVRLSAAETHVAWLVTDGASNRDIALSRGTAERTVANQVASIFTKLELSRRFDVGQFVLGLR